MENEDLDFNGTADEGSGSDELLSDDNLRLPDSANVLVRLHAVRAWLARRHDEVAIEAGTVALAMQQAMSDSASQSRPRRRASQQAEVDASAMLAQQLADAQQRLGAIEEARALLEDCIAHTNGERALVEYYLAVEQLMLDNGYSLSDDKATRHSPWFDAMVEVLQRVEHVGTPQED